MSQTCVSKNYMCVKELCVTMLCVKELCVCVTELYVKELHDVACERCFACERWVIDVYAM